MCCNTGSSVDRIGYNVSCTYNKVVIWKNPLEGEVSSTVLYIFTKYFEVLKNSIDVTI